MKEDTATSMPRLPGISVRSFVDAFDDSSLQLIILPTEKCNFRCSYCYEDFSIGKMNDDTTTALKLFLTKRMSDLRDLSVEWFGGEPLLALSIIEEIQSHILEKMNDGLRFNSYVTTNGYLLSFSRFELLLSLRVKYFQITLDGPKNIHDKSRLHLKKEGTFDTIWENILSTRKSNTDFKVNLRVHYTPSNWASILPLISMIRESLAGDDRYVIHFKSIEQLGGKNSKMVERFSKGEREHIVSMFHHALGNEISTISPSKRQICYAAKANSFVVRADGSLGSVDISP